MNRLLTSDSMELMNWKMKNDKNNVTRSWSLPVHKTETPGDPTLEYTNYENYEEIQALIHFWIHYKIHVILQLINRSIFSIHKSHVLSPIHLVLSHSKIESFKRVKTCITNRRIKITPHNVVMMHRYLGSDTGLYNFSIFGKNIHFHKNICTEFFFTKNS